MYIVGYLDTEDISYESAWTNTVISIRINTKITSQHMGPFY